MIKKRIFHVGNLPEVEIGSVWRLPSGSHVLVISQVVASRGEETLRCHQVDCVDAALVLGREMSLTLRFFVYAKLAWGAAQWSERAKEIHAQRAHAKALLEAKNGNREVAYV